MPGAGGGGAGVADLARQRFQRHIPAARGILLDGKTGHGTPRLLLQIFSETVIGPVFFEFIQRKEDEGFGEGNFTALFQSIERDQLRRGALAAGERSAASTATGERAA